MFVITRSKLCYTASGIIKLSRWPSAHRTPPIECDDYKARVCALSWSVTKNEFARSPVRAVRVLQHVWQACVTKCVGVQAFCVCHHIPQRVDLQDVRKIAKGDCLYLTEVFLEWEMFQTKL